MSKNKILYEYLDNTNNIDKEKNFNSIYSKIENRERTKNILLNISIMLFAIVTIAATSTSLYAKRNWSEEYEEYKNRRINSAKSIIDTKNNEENIKNLNMDYIYHDEIGIKIDRISISDSLCQIDIKFKTNEDNNNNDTFEFGYAIYDENNNIYVIEERNGHGDKNKFDYKKKIYQELGIKYNAKNKEYLSRDKFLEKSIDEECNKIVRINLIPFKEFPKSTNLYIRIFDVGYTLAENSNESGELIIKDIENFELSNEEWQFEIEIPEEYYQEKN